MHTITPPHSRCMIRINSTIDENIIIRIIKKEITNNMQTTVAEDTLERVAAGELELARAESELRRLIAVNGSEIMDLRTGQTTLRESSE